MLASEIIFNIKNIKSGGIQSDDARLSDEQILFIFSYYRAKLLSQKYTRTTTAFAGVQQNLGIVPVKDLTGNTIGAGMAIDNWRITDPIPTAVLLSDGLAITFVGGIDGNAGYQEIKRNRARHIENNRFTREEGYWFDHGDRVVVKMDEQAAGDNISIIGAFNDPVKVLEYVDAQLATPIGLDLDWNFEYPIGDSMYSDIFRMMETSEIPATVILPTDLANDSKDAQVPTANA